MPSLKLAVLFFAAGIVLMNRLQISSSVIPFLCVSGFICIFIFACSVFFQRPRFISLYTLRQSCVLFLASTISGSCAYLAHCDLSARHVSVVAPYEIPLVVAGEIVSVSDKRSSAELILDTHRLYVDTLRNRITGRVLVRIPERDPTHIPGTHVLVSGQMAQIPNLRNPGDFDYRSYLAQQQIHSILEAKRWVEISATRPFRSIVRKRISLIRSAIAATLVDATHNEQTLALLQALLLGNQAPIASPVITAFRQSGLSHLLAVSGLHVLCIGLILYTILRPFCLRLGMTWFAMEITRVCLTLKILLGYLCLTHFKPAVFRATVMTGIFIIAPLFQRPATPIRNLYIAAFVLLMCNPQYVFQPGFQLSFAAVSSILYVYPRLPSLHVVKGSSQGVIQHVESSIKVSVAAMIGTAPLTLYHFHMASAGGLFLNIIAIPATTGLLVSGCLILVTAPFHSGIALFFGSAAEFFSHVLLFSATKGAYLLPSFTLPPSPRLSLLLGIGGLVIFLITSFSVQLKWSVLCLLLSLVISLQWVPIFNGSHHPRLDVLFFDVGHGDAALITLPNDRRLLIDTGNTPHNSESGILINHMKRYQIECLDAVVLTHPDRDHTGGLKSLLEHHCVRSVYSSEDHRYEWPQHLSYEHTTLIAGDTLVLDPAVAIRVLSPPPALVNMQNRNNGSLVLSIEYGTTRFLFSGDAEETAEHFLVAHYPRLLTSEVVKVGHHGSSTSSTPSFVHHAAHPAQLAVISTGPHSQYGLPDEEVIHRWITQGATIHNTATSGALWVASDGDKIFTICW